MPAHADQIKSDIASHPWYLIFVLGAAVFAGSNFTDFYATGKLSSLIIAAAWLCYAFSWYARPFAINLRAKLPQVIAAQPLRTWVSATFWNFTTIGAAMLILIGLVLKFTNVA